MKDSKNHLISIIVPVYNVERYLDCCIDSILNQTYKNFELILIDDGSPDNCPKKCDEWQSKDNRIKVFHKKNGGLSDARNYGLKYAKGDYITFIDSDDYINSIYIEKLYQMIINYDADIACAKHKSFYESSNTLSDNMISDEAEVIDYYSACKELFTTQNVTTMAWGKLYAKNIVDLFEFPVGKNHEDTATICKYLYSSSKFKNRIAITQDQIYYYRQNNSSITSTKSIKNLTDSLWSDITRAQFFASVNEKDLEKMAWNAAVSCAIYQFIDCSDIKGWHSKWVKYILIYIFEAKVGIYLKFKVILAFFFSKSYQYFHSKK